MEERRGMFLIFSSMVFLSTKGLREASCMVRDFLMVGEIWGDSRIRVSCFRQAFL